jgi:hypothetical protein
MSYRGNDPSAGSPTETLLRLLLPLSSRIRVTFHGHSIGSPIGRPQSENLTLALNR